MANRGGDRREPRDRDRGFRDRGDRDRDRDRGDRGPRGFSPGDKCYKCNQTGHW